MSEEEEGARFFDKARREIRVGDFILYGHALGRCAGMQYGVVIGVEFSRKPGEEKWSKHVPGDRPVHLVVRGIDFDTDARWYPHLAGSRMAAPKFLNPGKLYFEERVIKVTPDQITPEVRDFLRERGYDV